MKRTIILWLIALVVTVFTAIFQRITGPTYPILGEVNLLDQNIKYKLERSHSSSKPYQIKLDVKSENIAGVLYYKRHKTKDDWTTIKMEYLEGFLVAELPPQPPAGKLEYKIELTYNNEKVVIPEKGKVIIRFKGDVPALALILHIIFIFLAMIFSTRTGLEYFNTNPNYKIKMYLTVLFLFLGGFLFGPLVQYYAFGAWWTGIPFGYDLTDNKTLIAFIGWLFALIRFNKSPKADKWILLAAILMLIIFLIPHSLLGSELDYSKIDSVNFQE